MDGGWESLFFVEKKKECKQKEKEGQLNVFGLPHQATAVCQARATPCIA